MKPKITWEEGCFGAVYGFVNGQRLFEFDGSTTPITIYWNIGVKSKTLHANPITTEEAKLAAQRVLGNFLEKIEYEKS